MDTDRNKTRYTFSCSIHKYIVNAGYCVNLVKNFVQRAMVRPLTKFCLSQITGQAKDGRKDYIIFYINKSRHCCTITLKKISFSVTRSDIKLFSYQCLVMIATIAIERKD